MAPYGPHQTQYRFQGPPGWSAIPGVTRIVIVTIAAVYLLSLVSPALTAFLILDPVAALRGFQVWRLLTFPFVNTSIITTLLYGYMLWVFGARQERIDGSERFAWFLGFSALSAGLLGAIAAAFTGSHTAIAAGAGGLIVNFLILWALREPEQEILAFFVLPIKVKWLVIVIVAVVVFSEIERQFSLARILYVLGGAPVAWYWARGRHRFRGFGLRERYYRAKLNRLRKRQGFRVVDRNDEPPSGGWVN